MSRKNQNSLIFLTTLGVYLGLVLVGGTAPQVFAHSALTRNFEIAEEVEIKDDLDNKPDADAAVDEFAAAFGDLYKAASSAAAADIEKAHNGQFNFNLFVTVKTDGGATFLSPSGYNKVSRVFVNAYQEPLKELYKAFLPTSPEHHEKFRVDFELTSDEVVLGTTLFTGSPDLAESTAAQFAFALSKRKDAELSVLKSLIYSKTNLTVDNDQVVIVTRLPRGSIDPLLAANAK